MYFSVSDCPSVGVPFSVNSVMCANIVRGREVRVTFSVVWVYVRRKVFSSNLLFIQLTFQLWVKLDEVSVDVH